MLNIIKSKRVRTLQPHKGDQGWLNAIYLWEKFDIGHEYNLLAKTAQNLGFKNLMENATPIRFLNNFSTSKVAPPSNSATYMDRPMVK